MNLQSEKNRPEEAIIQIKDLNKSFGKAHVLKNVSATFISGTVSVIIGASGSGKSTLLRTLNRLEVPDSGQILFDGHDITSKLKSIDQLRSQIGMVFQNFHLFSHLTVLQNIVLAPRKVLRISKKEAKIRALRLLGQVDLEDFTERYPFSLSGGQQQRVAIARSLAMRPRVMLFDEPTSALDPEAVKEVLDVIRMLADDGMTMIIVTHEMGFAKEVADRILFLDRGFVLADQSPDDFFNEQQSPRIRTFLGKILH
jgi:polar amino acid transport system ATP-binding protein